MAPPVRLRAIRSVVGPLSRQPTSSGTVDPMLQTVPVARLLLLAALLRRRSKWHLWSSANQIAVHRGVSARGLACRV